VSASLVIVPAGPGAGRVPGPDAVLVGLPLRQRALLTAARAGICDVRVVEGIGNDGGDPGEAWPDGQGTLGAHRIILLPANVIPQPSWLRSLVEMPLAPDTLWVDSAGTAVVETERTADVLEVARVTGSATELVTALRNSFGKLDGELDPRGRFVLESVDDLPAAEQWLLRSLIKDSEGVMSRHVERRISLAVTRRLVATRVTPNHMTVVSLGIGLTGAPFFLSGQPTLQLVGAFLFLLHSILDGCDGELARLKFLESRLGAALDFWGDNAVHLAVFTCMAIGWSLRVGAGWPLMLGTVACASTLLAATVLAPHQMAPAVPGSPRSPGARLADALAHRDFIYIVIILAAFGQAAWFLFPVAIGTPLFVVVRLWADRPGRP
jgi:phosphatidylglycerophosphate synthase